MIIFNKITNIDYKFIFQELKTNIYLASPIIVGLLSHSIMSLVDNIMVGKYGAVHISAISLSNSIFYSLMSFIFGFSSILSVIFSKLNARKAQNKKHIYLAHSLILGIFISIIIFIIYIIIYFNLDLLQQDKSVIFWAKRYFSTIIFTIFPITIFLILKQFSEGLLFFKNAMIATIIGNVFNIMINYILIFGKFGFPEMKVQGAAISTLIACIIEVIVLIFIMKKNVFNDGLILKMIRAKYNKQIIHKIYKLTIPASMQMFYEFVFFSISIIIAGSIDKYTQAANQIGLSIVSFTYMFAIGLSSISSIRIAYTIEKDSKSILIKRIIVFIIQIIFIEFIFMMIIYLFRKYLINMFLDNNSELLSIENQKIIGIGLRILIYAAIFQIFDGLQAISNGILKGFHDVKIPSIYQFVIYIIICMPLMYILSIYYNIKENGIWLSFFIALLLVSIFNILRIIYKLKNYNINYS